MTRGEVLLLSGGPHPFAQTTPLLAALIDELGCTVTIVEDPDDAAARLVAGHVDLFALNTLRWRMCADRHAPLRAEHAYVTPGPTRAAISGWVLGGGRMLACHGAPVCFDDWHEWGDLLGARWSWTGSSHPPVGEIEVRIAAPGHPIVTGLDDLIITDECYGFLEHTAPIEPLLSGEHGGTTHPLLWEHRAGAGHVVVSLLGHGPESFQHPTHAEILRRSVGYLLGKPQPTTDEGVL